MFTFLFTCILDVNIVSIPLFRNPASLRLSQTFTVEVRVVRGLEGVLRPGRVHTEGPSFLAVVPFKNSTSAGHSDLH